MQARRVRPGSSMMQATPPTGMCVRTPVSSTTTNAPSSMSNSPFSMKTTENPLPDRDRLQRRQQPVTAARSLAGGSECGGYRTVAEALAGCAQSLDQRAYLRHQSSALGLDQHAERADDHQPERERACSRATRSSARSAAWISSARPIAARSPSSRPRRVDRSGIAHDEQAAVHRGGDAPCIRQLGARDALRQHNARHLHLREQAPEQRQQVQHSQGDQRPGIRNDDPKRRRLQARAPARRSRAGSPRCRDDPTRRASLGKAARQCAPPARR